jgi:FkbH-like protein
LKSFAELKRVLKRDTPGMPSERLAILADSATQQLVQALRGVGMERGVSLDVYEAPFDQIEAQIVDQDSELYAHRPEITLIWHASEKLLAAFQATPLVDRSGFADRHIEQLEHFVTTLTSSMATKVVCFTAIERDDSVFGSFAAKVPSSWVYQQRRLNFRLAELAASRNDLFLVDLALAAADYGRDAVQDRRVALSSELLFSLDFLPVVANRTIDVIDALRGRARKCLILDLDNTVWGGVIGDDGMDKIEIGELGNGRLFSEIQAWAKSLKERGIVLAVCSKNDERTASEPFDSHPDMVLRLADIAVFVANWENKVDNIRHIQSILEIGFDSMVFLDDNPAEREIVRTHIADVCVPDLPEDPADWLPFLRRLNLFETASLTNEDAQRTTLYQQESKRRSVRAVFASEDEFLQSLEMVGIVEGFTPFNIPRVAQLSQRSNQFNLRTIRYTGSDLERIVESPAHTGLAISLQDKFGAHGLISVLILEAQGTDVFIDTWLMSCRVLKRGVERFALNAIARAARDRGATRLVGEYLKTAKNSLVQDHYRSLGFREDGDRWTLDLDTFVDQPHFIRVETRA